MDADIHHRPGLQTRAKPRPQAQGTGQSGPSANFGRSAQGRALASVFPLGQERPGAVAQLASIGAEPVQDAAAPFPAEKKFGGIAMSPFSGANRRRRRLGETWPVAPPLSRQPPGIATPAAWPGATFAVQQMTAQTGHQPEGGRIPQKETGWSSPATASEELSRKKGTA